MVFDYIDGGAEDEVTMLENVRAFREIVFRPRMAVGSVQPQLATCVLGRQISLPIILAPCGLVVAMHPDGGAGIALAAARSGTVSVLSTVAGSPLEEVAARAPEPQWFQLYAADRRQAEELIARAATARFGALVVTVDTPALGRRERDVRNGVAPPLRIDARAVARLAPQVIRRPRWLLRMAAHRVRAGLAEASNGHSSVRGLRSSRPRVLTMMESPFTWEDIAWARARWSGALVVKGILSGADARHAVDAGADAVVVSNHGGRQLEGAPATIRVLPEVAEAVGASTEVLLDGGVRRGSDVIKALALGARAVLIGRAYLYGFAVGGQAGVERILDVMRDEVVRSLTLMGCRAVADLDLSWITREPA